MALVLSVNESYPQFGENCFLAPNSTVAGDVICGDFVSIWFQAVIRGDVNPIRIGSITNIQDGAVIHGSFQGIPTTIGNQVTIGHKAIIHGCTIKDRVLIGMGAVVLDEVIVGEGCIIGASSLVLRGMELEPGYLYAGVPAKKIKPVTDQQKETIIRSANHYSKYPIGYGDAFYQPKTTNKDIK